MGVREGVKRENKQKPRINKPLPNKKTTKNNTPLKKPS